MNAFLSKLFGLSILIAPYLASCNDTSVNAMHHGIIKDLTGLDGCTLVIETEANGTTVRLEPMNLNAFKLQLQDGDSITFKYKEVEAASICMVGQVIELTEIRKK